MTTRAQSFRRVTVPWTARAPYSRNAVLHLQSCSFRARVSCVVK